MPYTTTSTRINRATTTSVRFTPRVVAAFLAALVRSAGAALVQRWRTLTAGAASQAAGAVQVERQRTIAPGVATTAQAGLAVERRPEVTQASRTSAKAGLAAVRRRASAPAAKATAAAGVGLEKHAYLIDGDGNTLDDGNGEILHSVT